MKGPICLHDLHVNVMDFLELEWLTPFGKAARLPANKRELGMQARLDADWVGAMFAELVLNAGEDVLNLE